LIRKKDKICDNRYHYFLIMNDISLSSFEDQFPRLLPILPVCSPKPKENEWLSHDKNIWLKIFIMLAEDSGKINSKVMDVFSLRATCRYMRDVSNRKWLFWFEPSRYEFSAYTTYILNGWWKHGKIKTVKKYARTDYVNRRLEPIHLELARNKNNAYVCRPSRINKPIFNYLKRESSQQNNDHPQISLQTHKYKSNRQQKYKRTHHQKTKGLKYYEEKLEPTEHIFDTEDVIIGPTKNYYDDSDDSDSNDYNGDPCYSAMR